jgi:membrane protease YdiL (CAAX protease family)
MSPLESKSHPSLSPRPVGLAEAVGWTGLYGLAQLIVVCLTLALIAISGLGWDSFSSERMLELFLEMNLDQSFLVIGVSTLGSTLLLIPLVRWRLGSEWRERLQLRPLERRHGLLVLGAVLPLSILSNELYRLCHIWLGLPPAGDTNHAVQSLSWQVSYPVLVSAVALGPAVGEELVFRGLIGEGLTRRWGIPGGVCLTALLFGLAHLSPAHAIATLPLGLFLHWVYLHTRSLWAPVTLHFLNNLLVISLAHFRIEGLPANPVQIATAFGCLTAIAWRLGSDRSSETPDLKSTLTGPFWNAWQSVYEGWSVLAYTVAFCWSGG